MDFSFKVNPAEGYVHCVITGLVSAADVQGLIHRVRREAETAKCPNVLLDLTEAFAKKALLDRFSMGVQAADSWGDRIRVAVVFRPAEITKFFENVAVNRGAQVAVLPSKPAALKWLKGESAGEE
jgi:hypothetical protein